MQSLDLEVLEQTHAWIQDGQCPWLCTIVKTTGSSPRPIGSMLGFCNGTVIGTLSGGCVEEDLLDKLARGEIDGSLPKQVEYGVTAEENEKLGLPCGGRLHIVVEQLDRERGHWVEAAVNALKNREMIAREVDLASGITELKRTEHFEALTIRKNVLTQSLGPKMRMLLVGAGQLAQVLSSLALAMDFDVVVTDPREQMIDAWAGPEIPLIHGLPDDVILSQATDKHSVIITLTHDPRIDDMALLEALETDAWYVGALGSTRTTEGRLKRLRELGMSEDRIARLHAPVGIPIGSKTPWEIAVAIMAEITQLKRAAAKREAEAASQAA